MRVEPRSFDQGRRKNDAFTHSARLPSVTSRVGLNLNFEFELAHELLMHLNLTFAKSMNLNLNLDFSKSMKLNLNLVFSQSINLNLNLKIKNKMNGSNQCRL